MKNVEKTLCYDVSNIVNPSNAEATFVQSTRTQKLFKPSKPCHVGIQWIGLAEYSQMNTHVQGFQSFFLCFCIILYWPPAA